MKKPDGSNDPIEIGRRKALARLGLAAGVAYAVPVVLHLTREAKAMGVTPCPPPDGNCSNNPPRCKC